MKTNLKTFPSEGCADVYEWYDLMQQWKEDFEKELREKLEWLYQQYTPDDVNAALIEFIEEELLDEKR